MLNHPPIKMKKSLTLILSLLITLNLFSQSFYDENTIQTIRITFTQSNWDQLLDAEKAGAGNYIMAQSININGVLLDSVGVKYKGNSTYNANQVKNPFHIELDTYKDQNYQSYTDIKLSNVAKDPSFIREVLSYNILRQYMVAPKSNFTNVYVNGNLIGLYVSSESVSKKFVDSNFYSKTNTFIKCNPPAGAGPGSTNLPNLVYKGQDSTQYYTAYELNSTHGWQDLINLCDTLNNNVNSVEAVLDVDKALWMLAFDNVLVNLDSYIGGFAQNYYLYKDDHGRFLSVVWDLNESFGTFSSTGTSTLSSTTAKQQMSHLLHLTDTNYPLVRKLLSIPMYKRMYLAHIKTILLENFSNNSYFTKGQAYQATISAAVQADPNKFFTYANFTANINTDVTGGGGPGGSSTPGITNLMNGRKTYLLAQADFTATEPSISNINLSNSAPLLNDQFTIRASVTNSNSAYLGYRRALGAPFQRIQMFDDGLHNDGAANDNVFGVDVIMSDIFMQYYIYAENNTIGKFSPVRAEHEYYTLNVSSPPIGNLVINEFMASNSTTAADPNGQFDDWIELYNNGNTDIDLNNFSLSDESANLMKWKFPAGAIINAKGYLIVWADNDTTQSGYHANFKLSASGETLFLVDTAGTILDQISYSTQITDTSFGRYANGTGNFQFMPPTFNAENMLTTGLPTITSEKPQLLVYPNPAHDSFTIKVSGSSLLERNVSIYNLYGSIVYQDNIDQELTIPILNWAPGMYIAKVGNSTSKIIIR